MYRAVSFDLDDTLYDFQSTMRHALGIARQALVARHPEAEWLSIQRMIEIREETAAELRARKVDLAEIRRQAFRRTLQEIGHSDDDFADELNRIYLRHRFDSADLFEDVLPAFDALGAGRVLGAISNVNSYPRHLGLDLYLVFVILSENVGVEKPDPRIFEMALRRARCAPHEMLHVGDSPQQDVVGALAAGCPVAWYNRTGKPYPPNLPPPTYEVRRHTELIALVGAA